MAVVSFLFAALVLAGILFFGVAVVFELVNRLRDRNVSPKMQLRRADLGRYPTWDR